MRKIEKIEELEVGKTEIVAEYNDGTIIKTEGIVIDINKDEETVNLTVPFFNWYNEANLDFNSYEFYQKKKIWRPVTNPQDNLKAGDIIKGELTNEDFNFVTIDFAKIVAIEELEEGLGFEIKLKLNGEKESSSLYWQDDDIEVQRTLAINRKPWKAVLTPQDLEAGDIIKGKLTDIDGNPVTIDFAEIIAIEELEDDFCFEIKLNDERESTELYWQAASIRVRKDVPKKKVKWLPVEDPKSLKIGDIIRGEIKFLLEDDSSDVNFGQVVDVAEEESGDFGIVIILKGEKDPKLFYWYDSDIEIRKTEWMSKTKNINILNKLSSENDLLSQKKTALEERIDELKEDLRRAKYRINQLRDERDKLNDRFREFKLKIEIEKEDQKPYIQSPPNAFNIMDQKCTSPRGLPCQGGLPGSGRRGRRK